MCSYYLFYNNGIKEVVINNLVFVDEVLLFLVEYVENELLKKII